MIYNCPATILQVAQELYGPGPPLHAGCDFDLSKAELHPLLCECISPWPPERRSSVGNALPCIPRFPGHVDASDLCVCVNNTT
jgi:hypothetical protein